MTNYINTPYSIVHKVILLSQRVISKMTINFIKDNRKNNNFWRDI